MPPFCRLVSSSHFSLRKNHFDDSEDPGLSETLRRTFHTDETHRIHPVNIDEFPFHRPVEQNMHDAAHMALALRCKIETHEPFLDKERFHFSYRNASPLRLHMMVDPRTILARGGMTLRKLFPHVTVY